MASAANMQLASLKKQRRSENKHLARFEAAWNKKVFSGSARRNQLVLGSLHGS